MRNSSLHNFCLGLLIVMTTFDAVVLPVIRLSIGDVCMLLAVLVAGLERNTIRRLSLFGGGVVPTVLILNAAIFFIYLAFSNATDQDLGKLISGFIRPFFFVTLAIIFYGMLESKKINDADLSFIVKVAGVILSWIVVMQYLGIAPPMYHNNPSFGEVGRFTFFSEGWRPTGLTNEASFVGIFLFLLFIGSIAYRSDDKIIGRWRNQIASGIIFIGCLASTSRIAVILAALFIVFRKPTFQKLAVFSFVVPGVFAFLDLSRFENILMFDGDASTIERYGSLFAYLDALLDPANVFGTGYLNSVELVSKYIDPIVSSVLGDRTLVAFSLPLQLAVELGPFLFLTILIVAYFKFNRYLRDIRVLAVLLASTLTGVQNFLFIYIFISMVIYERNSHSP